LELLNLSGTKTVIVMLVLLAVGLGLALMFSRFDTPVAKQAEPERYRRVICLAPSIAEIVFALGAQDRIVAVSGFCDYPPEAKTIPEVGSYLNPNFERILALKPDLIIYQGKFKKMAQFCQANALTHLNVKQHVIEDTYVAIQHIGDKLDRSLEARAMCEAIRSELTNIHNAVKTDKPVPVFVSMFRTSDSFTNLATIGPDTFINELIEIAGGRNIFDDVTSRYPKVSKESLLKRHPQAIFEIQSISNNTPEYREKIIKSWDRFSSIPAVRNQNIHFLANGVLTIPGPRLAQAARLLAERLHPEAFGD
jgi:iron complex transport system substrate-binding protein